MFTTIKSIAIRHILCHFFLAFFCLFNLDGLINYLFFGDVWIFYDFNMNFLMLLLCNLWRFPEISVLFFVVQKANQTNINLLTAPTNHIYRKFCFAMQNMCNLECLLWGFAFVAGMLDWSFIEIAMKMQVNWKFVIST